MKTRSLMCALLFTLPLTQLPLVAQAAESNVESVKAPESHNRELKVGDKAPDQYKREDAAIKNWKALGLQAPEKESHWVKMGSNYVLVQTTNGVVLAIQAAKR